jgi:transposase
MPLPAAPALRLTPSQHNELVKVTRYPGTPQSVVLRCRVVLGAAEGIANNELARQLSTSLPTVLLWRRRFQQQGLLGVLQDQPRSGRPRSITPEKEAAIVEATMGTKPKNGTHWSVRSMARHQGVSSARVQRIWKTYRLHPHRVEHFKFSNDPDFVRKVRDIVGLYLNPPDKALVFSVDEKSQIQALDRTQPILPLRPGLPERQTHDYERHGTTTLFAALNVLNGTVIGHCQPRHRHQEFLRFLDRLEASLDNPVQDVHIIMDNYGTHKHPDVKAWFTAHPRYHIHFTPTGSSWVNQIERWFAEITAKRIRRGTFLSVKELIRAIEAYIRENNRQPKPFVWTATAKSILRKLKKYKETLDTGH